MLFMIEPDLVRALGEVFGDRGLIWFLLVAILAYIAYRCFSFALHMNQRNQELSEARFTDRDRCIEAINGMSAALRELRHVLEAVNRNAR